MTHQSSSPVTAKDFYDLSGPELLAYCGADASKWARAFCRIKEAQGWGADDIDMGLMTGWFANAIEHSEQVRASQPASPTGGESEARQMVIEANNSLYGSHGYFHSLDGGPFDKYHLARGIEDLKSRLRSEGDGRCSAGMATPLMQTAQNAAKVVEGWSDAKRAYADRVTGAAQPRQEPREALRAACAAGGDLGCSCADRNYQWLGQECKERMAGAYRRMLSNDPAQSKQEPSYDQLRSVFEAAYGLCHGYDWNCGTAAIAAGYRRKLLSAVNAIKEVPDFDGKYRDSAPLSSTDRAGK